MTTASIRESEWDHAKVAYEGSTSGTVQYIYRRGVDTNKEWIPWLIAAPSAVLHRAGAQGHGLYVAKHTVKDTVLGRYEGDLVDHYDTRDEAMHSREAARLVRRGADKVLAVRSRDGGPGWDLLDGTDFARTPPCIPLVNDRRNTRPRLMPNCIISEHGYLKVTRSAMPAFNLNASILDNVDSELRTDYGDLFWDLIEAVGSKDVPLECD